jgi:uronate dehydrogenase
MEKILVTGAAGGIGTRMRKLLPAAYKDIRWSDIRKPDDLAANEEFMAADLANLGAVEKIVAGVEGIVHLGGFSVEGPWDAIHQANIVGCYNLFEAAYRAGVKRVVFASSNHAVGFYPRNKTIGVDVTTRPDSRYGVSKAFGEALGALYADKHGLRVTCLRIGNFGDAPIDKRRLAIWLKPEDMVQLIRIGLERRFGYKPLGKAEEFRDQAMAAQAKLAPDPIGDRYQGGSYCSDEYDADKRG